MLIEYDGRQHFEIIPRFHKKPEDLEIQKIRDKIKDKYAEENGYDLLRIPHTRINSIESILGEKLCLKYHHIITANN